MHKARTFKWILATAGLVAPLIGCSKPEIVVYEPRVSLDDLAPGLAAAQESYNLLQTGPTVGRFACGVAIARFVPTDDPAPTLALADVPAAEEAWWTETFRGLPAVRELVFLSRITQRGAAQTPAALCDAARRLEAPLLLTYCPNRFAPNTSQVIGVLYDTTTRAPIATLHASAHYLDEDGQEADVDDERGDQRDWDARYQAARAFERHLRTCVNELIALDEPLPSTQPHRWQTDPMQRWWIPRVIRQNWNRPERGTT